MTVGVACLLGVAALNAGEFLFAVADNAIDSKGLLRRQLQGAKQPHGRSALRGGGFEGGDGFGGNSARARREVAADNPVNSQSQHGGAGHQAKLLKPTPPRDRRRGPIHREGGGLFRIDPLDGEADLGGALVAALRLFFQSAQDDAVKARIHLGAVRGGLEFPNWQLQREHFVKDHAKGVEIGAMIDFERLFELFGRHVIGRAHDQGGLRGASGGGLPVLGEQLREAEIGDFDAAFFVN